MRSLLFIAIASAIAFLPVSDPAVSNSDSVLVLSVEYQSLLKEIESGTGQTSLEPLADFQNRISTRLNEVEALSEKDFGRFKNNMRGFLVNREEIVFVKPDPTFFQKLARGKGLPADIAFFDLLIKVRPDGVWSAYTRPQTDYSGCTLYGTGKLTELYGLLDSFKETFPSAYVQMVDDELDYVIKALTTGTCACEGLPSAIKEFELFIEKYPDAKITPDFEIACLILMRKARSGLSVHQVSYETFIS